MGAGQQVSRRTALASIAAGISFIALDTYSFTVTDAGRNTSLETTDDTGALLGIDGKTADVTPTFTNNFDTVLTLTLAAPGEGSAEFDVGTDGSASASVQFTLDPGETVDVGLSADASEITVDVQGTYGTGSIQLQRDFAIPSQAGQIAVSPTVQAGTNSGTFTFGLQNTGSIDAVLDSIRVDTTSTAADEVAPKNKNKSNVFELATSADSAESPRTLVRSALTIDSAEPLTGFTTASGSPDTVSLAASNADSQPGPERVFRFNIFQDDGKKVGMKGKSVTVTVGFADGSTRQFALQG